MSRMTKEERLSKLHQECLSEFDQIQSALLDQRLQSLQDRRFYSLAGAQWEGPVGEQFENKPRFEFNQVHLAVIRIFNEYRNNRITVDFQPADGSEDELADTCDGLYRADENKFSADEAYDNCFEEGVGGGYGAWRLRACYEDEYDDENEKQRITIEPIFDADSCVFFDLGAKRYDKSDAKRCYVLTPYTRKTYEEEFNDDPASWPKAIHQYEFDWSTPDIVWVCELYQVEDEKETIRIFQGLDEETEVRVSETELENDPDYLTELQATGFREIEQKKIKRRKVTKYLMSGGKMLTDGERIAGRCIPIVPYYAKRWVVDGVERCMGHVRLAKDAQRLMNMLLSWLAEMAARFDVEKPIMAPEQIAGHALMWAEDNVKKYPYLLANSMRDINGMPIPGSNAPTAYTRAPNIPPAMAALAQIAQQSLQDLLGNQQAGEQIQPNLSGKAVELIQSRLDMQVFIYMSNLAKSMKRSGEIWLSMMRDIVTEDSRRMKTIDRGNKSSSVVLNEPAWDKKEGKEIIKNEIRKANFDIIVDVGPSSSSKRAATVRAVTGLMQMTQDPETMQALSMVALTNIEGEGMSDIHQWARRRGVKMGIIKPTEDEQAELQEEAANAQPDPQSQYLMAAAEQAQADAAQSRAKTVQTVADADLKRAQTAKTIAETMGAQDQQQIANVKALQEILNPQQGAISND